MGNEISSNAPEGAGIPKTRRGWGSADLLAIQKNSAKQQKG